MIKQLLPKKNFYKANLHCHSNLSDGTLSPQELKDAYKEKGYQVLAITDHEGLFYHKHLSDPDFLILAGAEFEYNDVVSDDFYDWRVAHICVIKKDPEEIFQLGFDPEYDHIKFNWLHNEWREKIVSKGEIIPKIYSPENINNMIKRYRDAGFLVTYNHPKWSQEGYLQYSKYRGMNFMEIYNHGTYLEGHPEHNGDVLDEMLKMGTRVFPIAADDNHTRENMFGGYLMISADELQYKTVTDALERGDFYASTGVNISEISVCDGVFTVSSDEECDIRFTTDRRHVARYTRVKTASFPLSPKDNFVRAELRKPDGSVAYTRAYFKDELN